MDEVRLKEIEQWAQAAGKESGLWGGDWASRYFLHVSDLIAALREAWEEHKEFEAAITVLKQQRDEARTIARRATDDESLAASWCMEKDRADRAEAEVERLKREGLDALNEWAHEEKRFQAEIERLKAQCLLAGIQGAKDGDEIAAIYKAERDTLQAMWNTLADAAKDVLHSDRLHDKVPLPVLVKLEHAVYSEHHDTIKPAIMELERLRKVREAAEDDALGNWLGWESLDEHPHPADKRQRDLRAYAAALNKLHAVLNTAQDPAR